MLQAKSEITSQLVKISLYSLPIFFFILAWIYTSFHKKLIKISQNKLRVGCWFFLLYLLVQTAFFQAITLKMTGNVYLSSKGFPAVILSTGIVVSYISIILMVFKSKKLNLKKMKKFAITAISDSFISRPNLHFSIIFGGFFYVLNYFSRFLYKIVNFSKKDKNLKYIN